MQVARLHGPKDIRIANEPAAAATRSAAKSRF